MTVAALMAGMGFFTAMAAPSRVMLVRHAATARFGQSVFGRVYGFVYSGLDTGQALAPAMVFGSLMGADRFTVALIAVAVARGLAVLTALGVRQPVRPSPDPRDETPSTQEPRQSTGSLFAP